MQTTRILVTSSAGDKQTEKPNIGFARSAPNRPSVEVFPDQRKQVITGIGTSFTEASAFVLAHLEPDVRAEVMQQIYGADGANFSLARTHIGACDFCVEGNFSYADIPGDVELKHFSTSVDEQGFDLHKYPDIMDSSFDLLPMIKQANEIKRAQGDRPINIIASAWTAPAWMKDIEDWYLPGTGGHLKHEYQQTYADYLVKYLEAYDDHGISIWGLTPVNEPHGNSGQWESMHFTAASQRDFIKDFLGPAIKASSHPDTRLLIYDQNRDQLAHWAKTILSDDRAASYVYGTAVHWYESTFKVYEDVLDQVHHEFPAFDIIHTEGCIDDLGKPAPPGIADPERFQESGWFGHDEFWWNDNATDWAYTAEWAPKPEDHPIYTPVHRYARNIIESLNHWVSGWIDWNIVLDQRGGPNHVGNFCGAPIMIDTSTKEIYYTPIFYILSQFSRTIRPGDSVVVVQAEPGAIDHNTIHVCGSVNDEQLLSIQVLNTSYESSSFDLKLGELIAGIEVPANSLQTLQIQL